MVRAPAAAAGAILICLAASSCRTASDGIALPRLQPGASPAGEAVNVKGRLVRSGPCLAVEGNGTTVIIWARTTRARVAGNGTTVVIWVFARTDPPIRTGETVELTGTLITEDISGYAKIPDDPGCRSDRYLAVREARPVS